MFLPQNLCQKKKCHAKVEISNIESIKQIIYPIHTTEFVNEGKLGTDFHTHLIVVNCIYNKKYE